MATDDKDGKSIVLFGEYNIRWEWDAEKEKWWFSVVGMICPGINNLQGGYSEKLIMLQWKHKYLERKLNGTKY